MQADDQLCLIPDTQSLIADMLCVWDTAKLKVFACLGSFVL